MESYLHEQIGRRLADDRLSSSDIATDREDSPLQSKRSSMFSSSLFYLLLHILCYYSPSTVSVQIIPLIIHEIFFSYFL